MVKFSTCSGSLKVKHLRNPLADDALFDRDLCWQCRKWCAHDDVTFIRVQLMSRSVWSRLLVYSSHLAYVIKEKYAEGYSCLPWRNEDVCAKINSASHQSLNVFVNFVNGWAWQVLFNVNMFMYGLFKWLRCMFYYCGPWCKVNRISHTLSIYLLMTLYKTKLLLSI